MSSEIKIRILDIFFLSHGRVAFIVNSQNFVPPWKFEAHIFLDDELIGKFEFFKDIFRRLENTELESFSVLEQTPLASDIDYSKRKIEITFIQELDHRPKMFSSDCICSSLGVLSTLKYLHKSQQSSFKLDNEVIKYIEEECYPQLYKRTKSLLIKLGDDLNKLILTNHNVNLSLIFKIDFGSIEVETYYITEQVTLTEITTFTDDELNNSISHMYSNIADFAMNFKNSSVSVGVMVFILFEVLSDLKSNIKANNVEASVILENKTSIHLGKYYEGNFYNYIKIIESIEPIRIGPLYSYIRQNYSRILFEHEAKELEKTGESFALKLCKKYRTQIFVNICQNCGYVKRTPKANLCLNCGLFSSPLKKYFF